MKSVWIIAMALVTELAIFSMCMKVRYCNLLLFSFHAQTAILLRCYRKKSLILQNEKLLKFHVYKLADPLS